MSHHDGARTRTSAQPSQLEPIQRIWRDLGRRDILTVQVLSRKDAATVRLSRVVGI